MRKFFFLLVSIAVAGAVLPCGQYSGAGESAAGRADACGSAAGSMIASGVSGFSGVSAAVREESPLAEQYRAKGNPAGDNREAGAMERISAGTASSMSVFRELAAAGIMMGTAVMAQQANAANRAQAPPWDVGMIFIVILMYFVILSRSNLPWATGEYCLVEVRTRR